MPRKNPAAAMRKVKREIARMHAKAALIADYKQAIGWQSPPKDPAAVALGRRGGKANTPAQQAARRENGKRGGRPPKVKHQPTS